MYAFTPESATVYWLSPDHEEAMNDHYVIKEEVTVKPSSVEEITVEESPKVEKKMETMSWPCSTKPKNLYEKVHEGCNYATVESKTEPVIKEGKKEMTWEDYKAELDEWLSHKNKQEWKPKKVSWDEILPTKVVSEGCGNLFKNPEQAQKALILFIAVIFGFILGRSW